MRLLAIIIPLRHKHHTYMCKVLMIRCHSLSECGHHTHQRPQDKCVRGEFKSRGVA